LTIQDVVIVGAGPAGLQTAISAASELPNVVVVERSKKVGGQAGTSSHIENIGGYDTSGAVIVNRMEKAARKHGAHFILGTGVRSLEQHASLHVVTLDNGAVLFTKTVVLALGLQSKPLHIEGEATYVGREVLYGSVLSRVRACKGLPVAIVGGANSAGQLALYASDFSSYVTVLVRGEDVRTGMSEYLAARIDQRPNVEVVTHAQVQRVVGDKHLRTVVYRRYDQTVELPACALFVMVGSQPTTKWLPEAIERDAHGFVVAGGERPHETSVGGIFAVGDVNSRSVKRVGGAIGQGTEVVPSIHSYLAGKTFTL
jgi:thioredoxin reductase (NADPH)